MMEFRILVDLTLQSRGLTNCVGTRGGIRTHAGVGEKRHEHGVLGRKSGKSTRLHVN